MNDNFSVGMCSWRVYEGGHSLLLSGHIQHFSEVLSVQFENVAGIMVCELKVFIMLTSG